jgi:hypothetical protein
MRTPAFVVAIMSAFCIASTAGAQQGTAEIGGKVVDAQGGVLPGVNIVVTNEDTGVFRELISSPEGAYFVSQIVPGRYRIVAKLEGFKALDRRGIVLEVGRTTTLNLTMEVGGLAETLTVTGEAPLVDVSTAEIGGHISATELNDLPSFNRNYMALAGSVPGVVFLPHAEFLNDGIQANGRPTEANNIVFDGASNTDDLRGSNVGGQTRAANESIQEVQILTSQFDAEYGRASGAVVNAVTKSGTNSFSGSAFNYWTGKDFTSRNFFNKVLGEPKADVGKTEWGFTLGGPVVRNKLHFFVSVERLVVARPWARTFPSRPEFNYSTESEESAWNTMWRIDHQINQKHTWAFRWLREFAPQFQRIDGTTETLESYGDETDLDQTLVGTVTSVLSDTKVNTIRYGATLEDTVHSNPAWRAFKPEYARCVPCPAEAGADQALVGPVLSYDSTNIQAASTMDYSINYAHSLENTFSWFIPEAKGRHDVKFGARYTNVFIRNPNWSNMNGTFNFDHDLPFNRNDPRTYPNRFSMRVPGELDYSLTSHVGELYAQDKWQVKPNLTLSLGVRYDLEVIPIREEYNPLFSSPDAYPVDTNNIAPRFGFMWTPNSENTSVVRGGYGIFYDRTILGTVDNLITDTKFARSFTGQFPLLSADRGPENGQLPTEPILALGVIDRITPEMRALIDARYPPGTLSRNTGGWTWSDPEHRNQPYFHQFSFGYERQLFSAFSTSVDYVRMSGTDMFLNPDINIGRRQSTARNAVVDRNLNAFGILDDAHTNTIRLLTTEHGSSEYDSLQLTAEKRHANNWSMRMSYALSYSRGTTEGQGSTPQYQVGSDLNLDEQFGPASADRTHNFMMSGRVEVPKTRGLMLSGTFRALSGTPFTLTDDSTDPDQNGLLTERLPAGTYNAFPEAGEHVYNNVEFDGRRNGARGPGFMQIDLRVGYRTRLGSARTLDVFADIFNVTDHVNFTNPSGNRRVAANFLRLSSLFGASGFPRQVQIGARLGF